jgi:Spy/CpxP family protein refolding chaperone
MVQVGSRWVAVGLFSMSLGVAAVASADAPAPLPSPRSLGPTPVPPARLPALPGLSAAQRKELEDLHNKTQLQLAPLRAGIWIRQEELDAIWASESPSRERIFEKLSELDLIRGRIREILVNQRLAILAVLTPEQRLGFRAQLMSAKPPARQKNTTLGFEECIGTGDCPSAPPPGVTKSP